MTTLWASIAEEASAESPLWAQALRPDMERELEPVFSQLGEERFALGLETIYEGYLMHYGRPRLSRCSRSRTTPPARTRSTARSPRTGYASVRVLPWPRSRSRSSGTSRPRAATS